MNDFYKTCRWCHWFKNGKCLHGKTFRNGSETDIVYLAEEGVISEAIKEGFTERAILKVHFQKRRQRNSCKPSLKNWKQQKLIGWKPLMKLLPQHYKMRLMKEQRKRQKSLNRKNFVANISCKAVIRIVLQRFC